MLALGRLQAQTDRLSPGLAVVVERQQGPHCVLPPLTPSTGHLDLRTHPVMRYLQTGQWTVQWTLCKEGNILLTDCIDCIALLIFW